MTKTQIAAELATLGIVLTASQIKKASLADLQAQLDAARKPKAARKPRALGPHVFCKPSGDPKAVRAGSKKHILLAALEKGASLDDLMTATGWQKGVVQSAFQYDVKMTGFGVERRADGLYYLIFPKNLKTIPVATPDVSRTDALVAACR
ncbi:hypothetical protein [Roseinatronobacter sp. S2]|uniref:hypothetical protein n=1 Tax=Roseinatronobacter sp. S2 TaxID=3035471 RepID=UPI00240F1933|nr:hypothetical protein [Roseinatronobacter sp. S2]WFE74245.1 hypothetical protein P8S53_13795 [Roseinatronobacter sp. S2]